MPWDGNREIDSAIWDGKERRRGRQMRKLGGQRWEAGDKYGSTAAHDAASRFEVERARHDPTVELRQALVLACGSTSADNILRGRSIIATLPRAWIVGNIEKVAAGVLDLSDDWDYRRLLEVVATLDAPEVQARLVHLGMQPGSPPDVAEAAVDFMPLVPTGGLAQTPGEPGQEARVPGCASFRPSLRAGAGRRVPDTRIREIAHAALATLRVLLRVGAVPAAMTAEVEALLAESGT